MPNRVGMEVSIAVAEAVRLANADVIAAYPITPQTHIVEHLSELVADGSLDAEYICVESEHSAMSACVGSAAVGARSFTATASQGLALMHEVLFIASAMRMPIVMAVANRALSSPLSIWNDHSDVMASRDCGWIQYFVENGQDAFDHIFIAFRVGEDRDVLLPVMVNLDGFILSHVIEPHILLEPEEVDRFLPPFKPMHRLDPDSPVTMGDFAMPDLYTEVKKAQDEALRRSMAVIKKVWKEFGELTGRYYSAVETYWTEGAEVVLLTMGALGETASVAVDRLREAGYPVGLVKLRLWRPFPSEEIIQAVAGAKRLLIMDRAISFGAGANPVVAEIATLFYDRDPRPRIHNVVAGLGGRDVQELDFQDVLRRALDDDKGLAPLGTFELIGVRE
jgi:pyruvate ferredoxin oxidoreductase alpha subunit